MENKNEIWRPIKGYEGLYEVSNYGKVKSLINFEHKNRHRTEKILKPHYNNGYLSVALYDFEGNKKLYLIHRLVAETFIPNYENKTTVNHKDENKSNNYVGNLEWATMLEQNLYGTRIDRARQKLYKKVIQLDKNGNKIKLWDSILEAETKLNISKGKITCCCQKQYGRKTAGGYVWRYVNE